MTDRPVICVVDDEEGIRQTFAEYLDLHGFTPHSFENAAAFRTWMADAPAFDIALLDVTMPGEDGLSLARWLRTERRCGIIMVTARDDSVDKIVGLEVGADDYVAKPVDMRELLARIRALLRRMEGIAPEAEAATPAPKGIPIGEMRLDLEARTLTGADGADIPLTAMEFDLLAVLATHPRRVLSRDQLLEMSHRDPDRPFDRSIDVRIARIRRKIERDPARPEFIKSVRGVGYLFEAKQN